MSREIVFVAGSPAASSRSSQVARAVASRVEGAGLAVRAYSVRDFEPADLVLARVDAPAIAAFADTVKRASAIVLSSPVYKATYAGGLKTLVDVIHHEALTDRPALGIATTRLPAHGAEVERSYRALFAFFKARAIDPLVVVDDEIRIEDEKASFTDPANARIDAAARALIEAVQRH